VTELEINDHVQSALGWRVPVSGQDVEDHLVADGPVIERFPDRGLDRFQPMLHNAATDGGTWVECDVTLEQITARCQPPIERGAPALWKAALGMAEAHYRKGSGQG